MRDSRSHLVLLPLTLSWHQQVSPLRHHYGQKLLCSSMFQIPGVSPASTNREVALGGGDGQRGFNMFPPREKCKDRRV